MNLYNVITNIVNTLKIFSKDIFLSFFTTSEKSTGDEMTGEK